MTSISFKNVSKSFGKKCVLAEINFDIKDKEIFCIIGPSGSGKTTLLRILAGLEIPSTGSVFFDDKDITDLKPNRRNIGMVFQDYALWPHMNVYNNILTVLRGRKNVSNERERISQTLGKVGLIHKIDSKISELSGGEMQRVALARALVINPDILLMDEPLSNLDAKIKRELTIEMLELIKKEKITTVFVTHAQEEAYEMADRLAIMNKGRAEQIGKPEEVYTNPVSCFVADFMSESINLNILSLTEKEEGGILKTDIGEITIPFDSIPLDFHSGVMVIRTMGLEPTLFKSILSLPANVIEYRFNSGYLDMFLELADGRMIRKTVFKKITKPGEIVYLKIPRNGYFIFPENDIKLISE